MNQILSRGAWRGLFVACILLVSSMHAKAQTAWPDPDWQVSSPEKEGLSLPRVEKARDWLEQHGSKTGLVIRHGKIVGEWYWNGAEATSRFKVYSTTKSFASTAAGLVIADGKLSLDTTVGEILADVKPDGKRHVTVRHLLSMASGVHNEGRINDLPNLFDYALHEAPMDFAPGEKWDYNNTGLAILSPVILKATGKQLDRVLDEKLFQPIGIQSSDWTWEQRTDVTLPYSGLQITARGLARFGLLFLNQGKWQDQQLVSADWVAQATAPSQQMNPSYGYLWWNNTTDKWPGVPKDAYAALGRFDNDMLIVPSLDLIAIRQIGEDTESNRQVNIGELWRLVVEAVTDTTPK